ncbi:hypothetical protein AB4Z27_25390 [Cupriavidus sp. KB_39]|jgi:hypothetical protein|uniref:hypothetical protein n=1 Tax=Cupriavidus sp. KB_39 TaxID=3233036 RepID=UPI003F8EAC21
MENEIKNNHFLRRDLEDLVREDSVIGFLARRRRHGKSSNFWISKELSGASK